ncbi:MAG: hypothetical protein GF411_00190 [Candidatus Lokiarchaeota archaeon]|nr:hypothetical protein [Candidatus Lokiarchaeota archaeon]
MNDIKNQSHHITKKIIDNDASLPAEITVYTMKKCAFCDLALQTLHEITDRINPTYQIPKIIESCIDQSPELIGQLDISGIPTIEIGKSRLVGLPTKREIVDLLNRELFLNIVYNE